MMVSQLKGRNELYSVANLKQYICYFLHFWYKNLLFLWRLYYLHKLWCIILFRQGGFLTLFIKFSHALFSILCRSINSDIISKGPHFSIFKITKQRREEICMASFCFLCKKERAWNETAGAIFLAHLAADWFASFQFGWKSQDLDTHQAERDNFPEVTS